MNINTLAASALFRRDPRPGGIVKNGASIQFLSGDNSYTGRTTVNEGTLILSSGTSILHGQQWRHSDARVWQFWFQLAQCAVEPFTTTIQSLSRLSSCPGTHDIATSPALMHYVWSGCRLHTHFPHLTMSPTAAR